MHMQETPDPGHQKTPRRHDGHTTSTNFLKRIVVFVDLVVIVVVSVVTAQRPATGPTYAISRPAQIAANQQNSDAQASRR